MVKERYELLEGLHVEPKEKVGVGDPKQRAAFADTHTVFTKGQIVESERDLEKDFVNKFKKVVDKPPTIVSEERKAAVTDMIAAGPWVEDDRQFLETLSDDGFNRVVRNSQAPEELPGEEPPKDQSKMDKKKSTLGEDVTDQFPQVAAQGYRVFRNPAGKHQVTKPSSPNKPITPKALEAGEVDKFVENYQKEK